MLSAASHEVHDFQRVAFPDDHLGKRVPLDDFQIVFDGDAARVDFQLGQKASDRDRFVQFVAFAVEGDDHRISSH